MKIRHFIFFLTLLFVLLRVNDLYADILNVSLTPVSPVTFGTPTTLGANYFFDNSINGDSYEFDIDVQTFGESWSSIYLIKLTISGTPSIEINIDPGTSVISPSSGVTVNSCVITENAPGADCNDFKVKIIFTLSVSSETPYTLGQAITAEVYGSGSPSSNFVTSSHNYGIIKEGIKTVAVVTPLPTGELVDGEYYYLAGIDYVFGVQVTANAHNWSCINNVTLTIPIPSGDIVLTATDFNVTNSVAVSGATLTNVSCNITSGPDNFTLEFRFRIGENQPLINSLPPPAPGATITASADSNLVSGIVSDLSPPQKVYGIVSVGITSINTTIVPGFGPTVIGSPTENYFLPSQTYKFNVNLHTAGHSIKCINNVTLTIPGRPVTITLDSSIISTLSGSPLINIPIPAAAVSDGGYVEVSYNGGLPSNFDLEFTYTPPWSFAPRVTETTRNITTTATFGPMSVNSTYGTHTLSTSYGVCSGAKVLLRTSLSATLSPDIRCVNPWNNPFTIYAYILYDTPNAVETNTATDLVPNSAITSPELVYLRNTETPPSYHSTVTAGGTNNSPVFDFTTPAWFSLQGTSDGYTDGVGRYSWYVRATIGGATQVYTPQASTSTPYTYINQIICDKIMIVGMQFTGGGGYGNYTDPPPIPNYIRNINTPGTNIRVRTQLEYLGTVPPEGLGSKTITLTYDPPYSSPLPNTDITFTSFVTYNGTPGWSDWEEIRNPTSGDVSPGTTVPAWADAYSVIKITGSGDYYAGAGQSVFTQSGIGSIRIYWENRDPPNKNDIGYPIGTDQFTDNVSANQGSDSITFNWKPLDSINYGSSIGSKNADLYTYRIYYKPTESNVWSIIDRDTTPSTVGITDLGILSTGTYTLGNLQSMVSYDYYLTALDIFGNETLVANRGFGLGDQIGSNPYGTVVTNPATYRVKISDGITTYDNNEFADVPPLSLTGLTPEKRPLRASAIKIDVYLAGRKQPDQLYIILREFGSGDFVIYPTPGVEELNGNPGSDEYDDAADYYRIKLSKVSPNSWQGFIPDGNPLIAKKSRCMFILEIVKNTASTYNDYDSAYDTLPLDHNNYPWTFSIKDHPNIRPWPTMVLNNVITDKDPVAYPAYYLTEDAIVTITAYDIKGRVVAVLLENALRKKGINIKENGWRGTNRAGRKLGIGLYYVRIKAVSYDGRVLIDKYNKVVMAR